MEFSDYGLGKEDCGLEMHNVLQINIRISKDICFCNNLYWPEKRIQKLTGLTCRRIALLDYKYVEILKDISISKY